MNTIKNTAILNSNFTVKSTAEAKELVTLAAVYSQLLGEEITQTKLYHLLHVQLAGLMLFLFAAWNALALIIGVIWFATALYGAKAEWEQKS